MTSPLTLSLLHLPIWSVECIDKCNQAAVSSQSVESIDAKCYTACLLPKDKDSPSTDLANMLRTHAVEKCKSSFGNDLEELKCLLGVLRHPYVTECSSIYDVTLCSPLDGKCGEGRLIIPPRRCCVVDNERTRFMKFADDSKCPSCVQNTSEPLKCKVKCPNNGPSKDYTLMWNSVVR
jgi:hypothetical protein